MKVTAKQFYWGITAMLGIGYLWLTVAYAMSSAGTAPYSTVCIFKNITGIACPSCGSTHAILRLIQLDFAGAMQENPLGYVLAIGMLAGPLWLLYDAIKNKQTAFETYLKCTTTLLNNRAVAMGAIAAVLLLWTWNILK